MRESDVERHVCGYARTKGWKNIKLGQQGWPDRLFYASGGRIMFVEFKRPGGEPRPLQMHRLAELATCDFDTYVIDTKEEGEALFNAK